MKLYKATLPNRIEIATLYSGDPVRVDQALLDLIASQSLEQLKASFVSGHLKTTPKLFDHRDQPLPQRLESDSAPVRVIPRYCKSVKLLNDPSGSSRDHA